MNIYIESLLNGLMVYWDEEPNAARYYVHLLVGDKHFARKVINGRETLKQGKETFNEIAVVEVERNIRYYSFDNLGKIDRGPEYSGVYLKPGYRPTGKNYYIYVEAEDKSGKIISKSEKVVGSVYILLDGSYIDYTRDY